jgi:hypothetical protein
MLVRWIAYQVRILSSLLDVMQTVLDNADALGFFNVTSNYDPATSTVPRLSYFWSNDYHPTSSGRF